MKLVSAFCTVWGGLMGVCEHIKLNIYSKHAEAIQRGTLLKLMRDNKTTVYGKENNFDKVNSIEDYQKTVPLSTYLDYEDYILRMAQGEKGLITNRYIRRFTESSGSTGRSKLIPLSGLAEWNLMCFDVSAPVGCAVKYYLKKGRPLPVQKGLLTAEANYKRLPCGATASCLSSIPVLNMKPISRFYTTSPKEIMFPAPELDMDMHYFKLRYGLMQKDISYIGTIFITTLESMFFYLEENWKVICDDIEKGTIDPSIRVPADIREKLEKKLKPMPKRAAELRAEFEKGFDVSPIVPRIWKKCGWMYGMGTGALKHYQKKLRRYIGEDMAIHYVGYVATEALMAVPIEMNSYEYVILPHNAFFEFRPLDADENTKLLTIGELEVGKEYEVVLTNLSGFYRYQIEDVVRVTGYYNQLPKVTFCYRLNQIANISGEKINQLAFDEIMGNFSETVDELFVGYSIYPDRSTSPGHYELFIEGTKEHTKEDEARYSELFEEALCKGNVSVGPLIKSGALGHCKVNFLRHGTYDEYRQKLKENGANLNQIKPIKVISEEKKDFFFSHISDLTQEV